MREVKPFDVKFAVKRKFCFATLPKLLFYAIFWRKFSTAFFIVENSVKIIVLFFGRKFFLFLFLEVNMYNELKTILIYLLLLNLLFRSLKLFLLLLLKLEIRNFIRRALMKSNVEENDFGRCKKLRRNERNV